MGPAALLTAFVAAILPIAPTEPTLVALGALAAALHESPLDVIIVGGIGCSVSDHLFYAMGRWGGARLLARLSARPAIGRATTWLVGAADEHGIPVFIAARWLPAGGTAGALLTGTLHWPLRRFTPASLTGSMLWTTYAILLGYLGGTVTGNPLTGLAISLLVALAIGLVARPLLYRRTPAPAALSPSESSVTAGAAPSLHLRSPEPQFVGPPSPFDAAGLPCAATPSAPGYCTAREPLRHRRFRSSAGTRATRFLHPRSDPAGDRPVRPPTPPSQPPATFRARFHRPPQPPVPHPTRYRFRHFGVLVRVDRR